MLYIKLLRSTALLLCAIMAVIFSGCFSWKVSSQYDKNVNTTKYSSFKYVAAQKSERYEKQYDIAETLLRTKFQEQGLKYDSAKPDLFVAFRFIETSDNSSLPDYPGLAWAQSTDANGNITPGAATQWVNYRGYVPERYGKFVITIAANKEQKIIWQSTAVGPMHMKVLEVIENTIPQVLEQYSALQNVPH
jgi:hypothetical protein